MMPGVSFIGGKLSIIGGYSWPGGVDLIEQWDDDNEEWIKLTSPFKIEFHTFDKNIRLHNRKSTNSTNIINMPTNRQNRKPLT